MHFIETSPTEIWAVLILLKNHAASPRAWSARLSISEEMLGEVPRCMGLGESEDSG